MVRIITDSAADFEPFELEKLNIACTPLKVLLAGEEYEENINLGKDQFYELLASTGDTPKTSQPTPEHLMDLFAEAKAADSNSWDAIVNLIPLMREDSILEEESVKLGKFQGYETIAYVENIMNLYEAICTICPSI